jgi:hypothetical protein
MTLRRTRTGPGGRRVPASLDADGFPTLLAFFRGYLHQDWALEHSSAVHAARAFLVAADAVERAAVAAEWQTFGDAMAGQSLAEVRRALCDVLGSAWSPASLAEFHRLGSALTTSS